MAVREETLPIHCADAPEVYRSEHYGMERYSLPVKAGTYIVRLHFAETYDCNYQLGGRSFGVKINGAEVLSDFDPYRAAGGFACPTVVEYAGCTATDRIDIEFTINGMISGIEVFSTREGTPKTIRQITPVANAADLFIGKRQPTSPDARKLKILFIGNSMTFFWATPESVQAMLEIGTCDLRIEPHRSVHGGKNLEFHYNQTDALDRIKSGGFDFVVLQEYDKQLDAAAQFVEYAEKFDIAIKAGGAKPLLYAQPGHRSATDTERRTFMKQCTGVGRAIGAPIVPVCETLRRCYEKRPDLTWHNADTVHMGMYGGYAVACTFYAALTGGASFPPPAVLVQQVAIDPDIATFIQRRAVEAVREYTRPLPVV